MLRRYIRKLRNSSGFSLVEVLVAVFMASLITISVVESYRYVVSVTFATRKVANTVNAVNRIYTDVLLGKVSIEDSISTNVEGVEIYIKLTNIVSRDPLVSDVLIFATNGNYTFSVLTSIH